MRRFIAAIALTVCAASAQYSPNLRIDSDMNGFVRRLATRHRIDLPASFHFQPIPASELLCFLATADSLEADGKLSPQELLCLKRLRILARGKPNKLTFRRPEHGIENHLNLALIGEASPSYADSVAMYAKGAIRPELTGAIGRLSYFSSIDVWTEMQTDTTYSISNYEPFNGIPYNLFGRKDSSANPAMRSSDMLRGGISLSLKRIDISAAIDNFRTGPSVFTPVTFSGYAPPLTYVRSRFDMDVLQYFHTFGLLRCQKNRNKYFYAHRFEIPVHRWGLMLGINEAIIGGSTAEKAQSDSLDTLYYGEERTWEIAYLIPFVPYKFAEHYVGDKDNAAISFDASLVLPHGIRCYAEFLLDDITTPVTIFSDDWGNKWALTAGAEIFSMAMDRDVHALVEYTRVEPWVYTHFYGGSHRYTHFNSSLGAPLGPNSAVLSFLGEIALHPLHTVGILLRNERKNESVRGGSIEDVFQHGQDSGTKQFLGNGTRTDNTVGLIWTMSLFNATSLSVSGEYNTDGDFRFRGLGRILF